MESGLISVIVPVYNAAAYLDECVASIAAQTYTKLNILLVDDGSTDGSGALCDAWAEKDGRVRVVHRKNAGVSAARNAGLCAARGDYVTFVDADDWIAPDMYATLLDGLKEADADIAVGGVLKVLANGAYEKFDPVHGENLLLNRTAAMEYLIEEVFTGALWNKLYKAELLRNERLDETLSAMEDYLFNAQIFSKCGKVLYIPEGKYFYRQHTGSATHTLKENHTLSYLKVFTLLSPLIETEYPELAELFTEMHKKYLVHGLLDFLRMNNARGKELFRGYKADLLLNIKNQPKCRDALWLFCFSVPYAVSVLTLKLLRLDKVKKESFIIRIIKEWYR